MNDLAALHAALQAMAAAEDLNAVNSLIAETVRHASQDAPLPVRKAARRLSEKVPKLGSLLSREVLAAIGRLEGWDG